MKKLLISIGILCAVCLGGFGMQSLKANADVAITELEETVEEVVEETVVEEVIEETTEEINPTAVVPPGTTYIIQGTLYWQDDNGRAHPLRYMQVEVRDKTNAESMGFVYTDANGFYQLSIRKATTIQQVYICVYAYGKSLDGSAISNPILKVVDKDGSDYFLQDEPINIFNINQTTCNVTINMTIDFAEGDDIRHAFEIAQAAITALHYAQNLGATLSNLSIEYPHNEQFEQEPVGTRCFYSGSQKTVYIEEARYNAWDTIMHEVGHHVSYCVGIDLSPGGNHFVDANCIDLSRFSTDEAYKRKGIRLSWGEGWASFFGQQAQQYYASWLLNIKDANGQDFHNVNLESPDSIYRYFGEGGEATILGLLYDLYDDSGTDESWDTIALGHQNMWDYAADSHSTNFSDFSNYLLENNLVDVAEYGKLLSYYNMAPSMVEMTNENGNLTFTWNESGGSVRCPNNRFTLMVYPNTSTTEVICVENITEHTYTLTDSEQNDILYTNGLTFRVAVIAYQTTNTLTGGYQSQEFTFTKPTGFVTVQKGVSIRAPHTEVIQKISPGQTFRIIFTLYDGNACKIIQTLGNSEQPLTTIRLYQGDTLLAEDTGLGYENNAFVHCFLQKKTQYRIEISFDNPDEWGQIKVLISSAVSLSGQQVGKFSALYRGMQSDIGDSSVLPSTPLYQGHATAFAFIPKTTGVYKITMSGNFEKSLRIVRPTNAMAGATNIPFDSASQTEDAIVGGYLTANIPYLIFYWQTDITAAIPNSVNGQIVIEGLST